MHTFQLRSYRHFGQSVFNYIFLDSWSLPGGFVLNGESLENAVARELREETGVEINYLEQLYTFGAPNRDPRQHTISIAYFALVNANQFLNLKATTDAAEAKWFSIDCIPTLGFDHSEILNKAINRLRTKIIYQPIGFELLDRKFPFSDLEHLYNTLLGRPIDRRNFKKKINKLGILDELPEKAATSGAGRPGNLFKFNQKRYQQLIESGMHFEI